MSAEPPGDLLERAAQAIHGVYCCDGSDPGECSRDGSDFQFARAVLKAVSGDVRAAALRRVEAERDALVEERMLETLRAERAEAHAEMYRRHREHADSTLEGLRRVHAETMARLVTAKADAWDEGFAAAAENVARELWAEGEPARNPYRSPAQAATDDWPEADLPTPTEFDPHV